MEISAGELRSDWPVSCSALSVNHSYSFRFPQQYHLPHPTFTHYLSSWTRPPAPKSHKLRHTHTHAHSHLWLHVHIHRDTLITLTADPHSPFSRQTPAGRNSCVASLIPPETPRESPQEASPVWSEGACLFEHVCVQHVPVRAHSVQPWFKRVRHTVHLCCTYISCCMSADCAPAERFEKKRCVKGSSPLAGTPTSPSYYQNLVPINPGFTRGHIIELCWRITLSACSKILQLGIKDLPRPCMHPYPKPWRIWTVFFFFF